MARSIGRKLYEVLKPIDIDAIGERIRDRKRNEIPVVKNPHTTTLHEYKEEGDV